MKKLLLLLLATAMTVVMCSCSGLGGNISDGISPPKPSGELYDIQQALEAYVGERINLVYPSSGKYRSAIITNDLDGDGKYEVFSFYSTETDDKTTVMHINYIRWTGEKWVSVSDLQVDCAGVESVEFAKLDNSNMPKIIVNWTRLSSAGKQLSVYKIDTGLLTEVTSANYSVYATCDFNSDGISDIVAVYLDSEKSVSTATLLSLGDNGFIQGSTCVLDGTVTSYYKPRVSRFTDGTPALFIDADKSTGIITEALYLKDGELTSAFGSATGENIRTLRTSSIRSEDINGDGCIDIPLAQKLPAVSGNTETDSAYMTIWNSFDGVVFTPIAQSIVNYTDGYMITIPEEWVGAFTVTRRTDINQRIILRWNEETKKEGEEILRIQVVRLKEWDSNRSGYENYVEIARDSESVYIVRFGNSALNPGEQYIRDNFRLITSENS